MLVGRSAEKIRNGSVSSSHLVGLVSKQIPIPSYFVCQTRMPNSNFFPVRHPTENPFLLLLPNMRGKIQGFSRATPARSECQPLLCFFRSSMLSEAKHPVCEGGNVSTVARNMCFSPRSKIWCRTLFVWSTRQRRRGCGRNVLFFSVHAYCGKKILGATIFVRPAKGLTGFV